MDVWYRLFVPSQFFVFWLGHCLAQLHALRMHPDLVQNSGVYSNEWYMVFLCAISQICDSPLTLTGTCVAMSYASSVVLSSTKILVQSYHAYLSEQNAHAGLTEGTRHLAHALVASIIRFNGSTRDRFDDGPSGGPDGSHPHQNAAEAGGHVHHLVRGGGVVSTVDLRDDRAHAAGPQRQQGSPHYASRQDPAPLRLSLPLPALHDLHPVLHL